MNTMATIGASFQTVCDTDTREFCTAQMNSPRMRNPITIEIVVQGS